MPAKQQSQRIPAIRSLMMPRDINPLGSIFGGHILSLIDLAATQHARLIAARNYVTKLIREVEFISPVFVGDVVSFYAETMRIGRTSVCIKVDVEACGSAQASSCRRVTSAEIVMVAVDKNYKPVAILKKNK